MFRVICLFFLLVCTLYAQQINNVPLHGKVVDENNNLPIAGCTIYIKSLHIGCITDSMGLFNLNIPLGEYQFSFSHISYQPIQLKVALQLHAKTLTVSMKPATLQQREVQVTIKRNTIESVQEIPVKDLIRIPTIYNDVLRSVTILSGVVSNNEMSSGYQVRGGNNNENLIYLNGYEIYRPFLLRQGIEENQSMINQDMVDKFEFYNGAFPANLGDKMSSALEVSYGHSTTEQLGGVARLGLLQSGLTLHRAFGDLSLSGGIRYSHPSSFVKDLQTSGKYHPEFFDVQLLAHYALPDYWSAELFILNSYNQFNNTPANWVGNFRDAAGGGLFSSVAVNYEGERLYSFNNNLVGLRARKLIGYAASLQFSYALYHADEAESGNLYSSYFYIPDAQLPETDVEYLKSRMENYNNHAKLLHHYIDAEYVHKAGKHTTRSGLSVKLHHINDFVQESAVDTGISLVIEAPLLRDEHREFSANEYSLYATDEYKPNERFTLNAGLRATYAAHSRELLVSPRVLAAWKLHKNYTLTGTAGVYYQPTYYLEGRLNDVTLKSQRNIQLTLALLKQINPTLQLRVEGYYKALQNLVPYYTEGQRVVYKGSNSLQGYATGIDAMLQGELVSGIQSWVGYGYLNTKERPKSGGAYQRRLTDQTHSLLIFLQDRIPKRRNIQVHTRFQVGTGMLYNNRQVTYDAASGKYLMTIDMNDREEYFIYMRADMGCSIDLQLGQEKLLKISAEVLNVFNTYNYAGFRFVQVFSNIPQPIRIPEVLSSRFYSLQFAVEF